MYRKIKQKSIEKIEQNRKIEQNLMEYRKFEQKSIEYRKIEQKLSTGKLNKIKLKTVSVITGVYFVRISGKLLILPGRKYN